MPAVKVTIDSVYVSRYLLVSVNAAITRFTTWMTESCANVRAFGKC